MKYNIEQLVDAWMSDNKYYIDENFEDVEEWLLHWIENGESWYVDFFTDEEIESMTIAEMAEIAKAFVADYRGVKVLSIKLL